MRNWSTLREDELLGIEIGFHGPEFTARQSELTPVWTEMLTESEVTQLEIGEVLERSGHASWLNPVIHSGVYYVHALSGVPEARGKRVGMGLLNSAIERARTAGYKGLQLDVLSDNPAVNFNQSMGLELLVESRASKPEQAGVPPECTG
ncbi:MAG: GNAT superfamily N-acetyltransferase [Limisphaerales bacterium]